MLAIYEQAEFISVKGGLMLWEWSEYVLLVGYFRQAGLINEIGIEDIFLFAKFG